MSAPARPDSVCGAAADAWSERVHPVHDLRWGASTTWCDGVLTVGREALVAEIGALAGLSSVDVHLVRPGERVRLVHVLDAIEPSDAPFPGSLAPIDPARRPAPGERPAIARLEGAAVLTLGRFLPEGDYLRDQFECIVEMAGPAAAWSPFGSTCNVVLALSFEAGAGNEVRARAATLAGLRAARHLAGSVAGCPPARRDTFFTPVDPAADLPAVGFVCPLINEGRLHDCRLYGADPAASLPTLLPAGELAAGALVAGDYHYAGQRTPTYLFQSNPVLRALAARHGRDLRLAGVVLTRRFDSHAAKRRGAAMCANLLRLCGAAGAVVAAAAGGNAHIDAMFTVQACRRLGLAAVPILLEMAGPAGDDPGVVDFVPEADMIVSTGNREQMVALVPPERVLGDDGAWLPPGAEGSPAGACRVPLRHFLASTNQMGAGRLAGRSA